MKTKIAAAALLAALGVATAAIGQSQPGRPVTTTGAKAKHIKLHRTPAVVPDPGPGTLQLPDGYTPPAGGDLRAIQTIYDNSNTGTVYSYSATGGTTGVGVVFNGGVDAVQFGPAWAA